jgi:hypothetical protein
MAGTGTGTGTGTDAAPGWAAGAPPYPGTPGPAGAAASGPDPAGPRRWARDLALGTRFALAGGSAGWFRTALTAIGVGLGVAVLLLAASIPTMVEQRNARGDARSPSASGAIVEPGPTAVAFETVGTEFRGQRIDGALVRPAGAEPVLPPGLDALPGPGELAASPALRRLLESADGALLAPRLPYEVVAGIGDEGLTDPGELFFYAGSDELTGPDTYYIDGFGSPLARAPLDPLLLTLVVVGCAVLLLPVGAFIATAVRMGGERRDRRLSAIRLVGADIATTHRIAAGEALAGALLGLLVGAALFAAGRPLLAGVEIFGISSFPADVRPQPLVAVLVLCAVPVAAVQVTLQALRRVTIEPLGVVRDAGTRRRRLAWRLAPAVLGLLLLLPLIGGLEAGAGEVMVWQLAAGIVLLLTGVTAVLPWLVEAVVARTHGGPLPLQLATRRLRLDSGPAARAVSGVTVAVAGAIAGQMFLTGIAGGFELETGEDPTRAQARLWAFPDEPGDAQLASLDGLARVPGVTGVLGVVHDQVGEPGWDARRRGPGARVSVGECEALAELAAVGEDCRDGDVFLVPPWDTSELEPVPGGVLDLRAFSGDATDAADGPDAPDGLWTVPAHARTAEARTSPEGIPFAGVFATPGAFDVAAFDRPDLYVLFRTDPRDADVVERLRNAAVAYGRSSHVVELRGTETDRDFAAIERALYAGAAAVLLMIGAAMLVSVLEQLRERRRLLAVLVAFGTPRTVLTRSVLYQVALPVLLGLALAVLGGVGLGTLLLAVAGAPAGVPWGSVAALAGLGAVVIALTTLISLGPLWRMMRPDGLRAE